MARLSRADLVKIRDLILKDFAAIPKLGQIVDHVITLAADVEAIKAKLQGQDPKYAEAVLKTLEKWNSYEAENQADLLAVLEDLSLGLLAGNIRPLLPQSEDLLAPSFSSVPNLIHNFVERQSKLEELHKKVTRPPGVSKSPYALLTSLYGLGGIGKTTLAARYAEYFKEKFPGANTYWIEAETNSTLRLAFRHLGQSTGVLSFDKLETKVLVQSVYKAVYNLTCLFVFDNVTEFNGPDGIFDFLPHPTTGPQHYILATSRNADLLRRMNSDDDRVLQLDVFSESEADKLICKALPNSLSKPRKDLYTTLGRLPLALQQAVAYICYNKELDGDGDESCAIQAYLQKFNDNAKKVELLKSDVLDEEGRKNERTVYLTWQTTLATIAKQEHGELAVTLLRAMSYMNPDNIDLNFLSTLDLKFTFLSILRDNASLNFSRITKHIDGPHENHSTICVDYAEPFRAAVFLLRKYSMVKLKGRTLSVHRLVQDVVQHTSSADKVDECIVLFRIINHIYQYRQVHIEQCVLRGAAVIKYYDKYARLKKYFPDFAEIVFDEKRLLELVLKEVSTTNRAAALNLIIMFRREELAIDSALICITGMRGQGALEQYVATLLKISKKEIYNSLEAATIVNWLVAIRDFEDTLPAQILRLLPLLDRSVLTTKFLCMLFKAMEQEIKHASEKVHEYGFDIKISDSVKLPKRTHIMNECETYLRDLELLLNYFGDYYAESGKIDEEFWKHAVHLRDEFWILPHQYGALRKSVHEFMMVVDIVRDSVNIKQAYNGEHKDAIRVANTIKCCPSALVDALKFVKAILEPQTSKLYYDEYLHQLYRNATTEFSQHELVKYVNWIVARTHYVTNLEHLVLLDTLLFLDDSHISVDFLREVHPTIAKAQITYLLGKFANLELICLKGERITKIEIPLGARRAAYWNEWNKALDATITIFRRKMNSMSESQLSMQCRLHASYIYRHVHIHATLKSELGAILWKLRKVK